MLDPDRWSLKDILRFAGWGCIFLGIVLIFPAVGAAGGESHEPGADTLRVLIFEKSYGQGALVCAGLGLIILIVSAFVPDSDGT